MVIPLKVGFSLGCFGAGARGPGSLGLAPVVATASFPLINPPKFYLSFTILVSLILVKYPDRVGLVNTYGTAVRYRRYRGRWHVKHPCFA